MPSWTRWIARTRARRSSSGSVSGRVISVLEGARCELDEPLGDLDLAGLLVAGGEAAVDAGGDGCGRGDAGVAAAGEVDGGRGGEQVGEVAGERDRLVGGFVDGAAEVGLVRVDELAGGVGVVVGDRGVGGAVLDHDRGPRRHLGRAGDRRRVGDEPARGGEQLPGALVGLGALPGEDGQRPEAVRPHPAAALERPLAGLEAKLVDPPRAGEVVDDRQPARRPIAAAGRLPHAEHERRAELAQPLGALRQGAAQRHRRLGRAHLPHHPPPPRRRRGGGDRDPLLLRPRRPPRAGVVVAPQRQAVGRPGACPKRRRGRELGAVVGAHPAQRRPHRLLRRRPLEGVRQPGLGDDVAGHEALSRGARCPRLRAARR